MLELPPSRLLVESLTNGQLANAYRNLSRRADRTAVARSIALTAPVLESWPQTYVQVRNVCAHRARLWNVGLGVYPPFPNSPAVSRLEGTDALPER
ncbi:Abi family protein [Rhodococcus erythropolis]|uniref:Abi family protein n=1 Tax=Rhodococcus erythropolis TaxID=1833 RepID=UPI0035B5FE7A